MKNDFLKLYSKVFLTSVGIIGTIIGIVSFFFTLESIIKWKSQNDDCAKILMNHIEKHLTSAGKTALMRKEMLDVIDKLLWKNTACQARIPDTFLFRWQKKHVIM